MKLGLGIAIASVRSIGTPSSSGPFLDGLAISPAPTTLRVGTPASGTITNATAGSTISLASGPSGFTINSAARTWSYDGTGSAASGTLTLTETLAGATNSPRANNIAWSVAAAPVTLAALGMSPAPTALTTGTPSSGTITGATSGSSIALSGAPSGLTINSGARTWSYDGTGSASSGNLTLTETLAGAANTPRASTIGYAVAAANPPITIAFAGSSSPEQYLNTFTGGTSSPNVTATDNGTTFSTLTAGRFGVEAGKAINSATGRPVRFIRGGVGGTTLIGWDADTSGVRSALVARINAAGGCNYLLLQVGYNDLMSTTSTAQRVALIRSLIGKLRSETSQPNLVIFIAGTQDNTGYPTELRYQREAELTVANADANVRFAFSTFDLATSDGTHQTEAAHVISGARFAAQVNAAVLGTAQKRAAKLASTTAVSDTVTDVTVTHVGGTDFTPTTGITGFTLYNGSGAAVAISSAARTSATMIRITHASKGSTAGTLVYMPNGNSGDDATLLKDNSSLALPFDPTSTALSVAATAVAGGSSPAKTAKVAFAQNSTAASDWNRFLGPGETNPNTTVDGASIALKDSAGASTGWSVATTKYQGAADNQGQTTGNDSGVFPDPVMGNYWYNGASVTGAAAISPTTLTFSGLDPAKTYSLVIFGSRTATNRFTDYSCNGSTQTLDCSQNTTRTVTFSGLTPNASGQISFSFKPASGMSYGYLNALTITQNAQ